MKPWWKRKSVIAVNVAAAMLVALEVNLNILQPLLPVNVYGAFVVALACVNAGLRIFIAQAFIAQVRKKKSLRQIDSEVKNADGDA